METILSIREGDHFDLVKEHNILVPINILEREREREVLKFIYFINSIG